MTTNFKTAADFRKSLEARLKNIAATKNEPLQRLRRKVAFDRFLARLFSSGNQSFFVTIQIPPPASGASKYKNQTTASFRLVLN